MLIPKSSSNVVVTGFTIAVVGVMAVFMFHNQHTPAIANLYSLHTLLGIIVLTLWGLLVAGAIIALLSDFVPTKRQVSFVRAQIFSYCGAACLHV
eukprot:CFRG2892T1